MHIVFDILRRLRDQTVNCEISVHEGKLKQEDLLDLITALLKFNCFLSTTVAKQCTFLYNPAFIIYKFHRVLNQVAVAQWSRRLPPV